MLSADSGYREDSALARRADVLVFAGEPLSQPLDVVGVPRVTLAHRSDGPDADLWVRVSEVDRKGRSRNVTETFRAAPAPGADGRTVLELDPAAHRFAAGSRIGLLIGGGSFPRYARNLGMPGRRTEGTTDGPDAPVAGPRVRSLGALAAGPTGGQARRQSTGRNPARWAAWASANQTCGSASPYFSCSGATNVLVSSHAFTGCPSGTAPSSIGAADPTP